MQYNKEIHLRGFNNGYLYFIDTDHPLATGNSGRVYYHRHQASVKLDRWLLKNEQVHHIDGNAENNELDNLLVCTAAEHARIHKGIITEKTCKQCKTEFLGSQNSQEFCSMKCSQDYQVKDKTITKELLDGLIPTNSWTALGKMFGYSDVGIKKRARALGCIIPNRKTRA